METKSRNKTNHSQKIAEELMHLLADTYLLYIKTQNFHWNVKGPFFPQLHQLFDTQYNELADAIDVIAERIRALEAQTPASFSEFQKLSSLKEEIGCQNLSSDAMVKKLTKDHDTISQQLLLIFEKAEQANDQGTIDLLTERLRAHEKAAWMLRSSL